MSKNREIVTNIAVIGAGASGMMAALSASANCKEVTLIEGTDRIGKKILSTGNGKCNMSHIPIKKNDYHGSVSDIASDIFDCFGNHETLEYFKKLGLLTRIKDGYVYPYSEQASAVLDILRFAIENSRIRVLLNTYIIDIRLNSTDNCFDIISSDKSIIKADKVIFTTGGCAAPGTGSDGMALGILRKKGYEITEVFPALVKVKSTSSICKSIDGVRAKGLASLYIDGIISDIGDQGEIQFTRDGLSGIPIFNMSGRIAAMLKQKKQLSVHIDLFPDMSENELADYVNYKINSCNSTAEEALCGLINKKLCMAIMKISGISASEKASNITDRQIRDFNRNCKNFAFEIADTYGFEQAQVTAGGVSVSNIDNRLQSKLHKGLYFAGEILDIDGICGGFNLQWAWSSGFMAGKYASED